MRFLHLQVEEGKLPELRRFYLEQVLPALDATEGCLFAALLQQTLHPDECVSLTVWRDRRHTEAYEASPVFRRLLEKSAPFLSGTTAWRVQSHAPGGRPGAERPRSEAYRIEASAILEEEILPALHVRLVSATVRPGAAEEFKERYVRLVMPVLRTARGCRGVFLVEDPREVGRFVSVTVWDREESAIRYEISGTFEELTRQLEDTFADLKGWHLAHAEGTSSSPLAVRGYSLVAARKL
jgi:quinol monooxygenase YgiN